MPAGRKSRNTRFEQRAAQFARLVKLDRLHRSPLHKQLFVNRRLIRKERELDFHATERAQHSLRELAEKEPPQTFTLVFPAHSSDHLIQEKFHAPNAAILQMYLTGNKVGKANAMMCKTLLRRPGNKGLTPQLVAKAIHELARFSLKAKVDVGENFHENVVILGMDRSGKVRLAVIDVAEW